MGLEEQSEVSSPKTTATADLRSTSFPGKRLRRRFLVFALCLVFAVYISKSLRLLYVLVIEEISGTVTVQLPDISRKPQQGESAVQALWGGHSSGDLPLPSSLYPYEYWTRPRASNFYYVRFPNRGPEGASWMEGSERSEWRFETSNKHVEVVRQSKSARQPFAIKTSPSLYTDGKEVEFTVTGYYKNTPYTFLYRLRSGTSAGIYFADTLLLGLWETTPRR